MRHSMSKDTAFLTEKQLHATHFLAATCYIPPWLSHNPVRMHKSSITGKSFFYGYEYPKLTAAIASWHRLCGKRYLQ